MKRINWGPVLVYYLLAAGISGPFFYWRSVLNWEGFHGPGFLKTVSYMWGPGVAGIACHLIYRKRYTKQITLWGGSLIKSLIIWFVPLLLLASLGVSTAGKSDHITPLVLSVFAALTIWGEEVGWRWFLQDYLQTLRPWKKYLVVGVLWELWHLRFVSRLGQPVMSIIFACVLMLVITTALAFLIGFVTDRTGSLFFACALHGWVDLCAEMPGLTTYISAAVMLVLCLYFYFTWDQKVVDEMPTG